MKTVHKIIRADFNSIYLWDSFVDVDDMNQNELLNLIQATYKPYKILLADDVQQILQDKNREMLQTQEELLNRLQEVQLMAEQEISDVIDLYLKKEEDFIRMNVQLEEQATELNTRISQLMSETDKANSNLEKIYKQLQSYKDMGFEVDLPMVMNEVDTQENINEEPIEINHRIDHIHHYIKHGGEKKLNFQNDIVKKIYAGLCTNQIIILSGNPGTGKTSLIKKFSESISAVYKHISVQPNWTDNQDLLGYFNPIDKQYIATPFLDAIIDANNDSSKLYIINLDEMNLSQVEYYFSEFLSVLQTEEKTLHLYSEHIANALGKSFKTKMDNSASLSDEEKNEINLKVKMHQRYPAKFNIPENIRFVGTLNKDATTKNLSPKVIDRSLIIEIQDYSYRSIINDEHSEVLEPLDIKPDLMQQKISIVEGNLETRLSRLGDFLKKYNIFLEGRFYAQVEQMIGSSVFEKENDLFDFIVASKILPKINMSLEGHEQFIFDFENEIENTTIAKKIFKAMELSAKNSSILSYWR